MAHTRSRHFNYNSSPAGVHRKYPSSSELKGGSTLYSNRTPGSIYSSSYSSKSNVSSLTSRFESTPPTSRFSKLSLTNYSPSPSISSLKQSTFSRSEDSYTKAFDINRKSSSYYNNSAISSRSTSIHSPPNSKSSELLTATYRPEKRTFISSLDENDNIIAPRSQNNSNNVKLTSKGLVGLKNLGNTCFMNSMLQCLSHTTPLLEYFFDNSYVNDINSSSNMKGTLAKAYANLMQNLWSSNDSFISPSSFKSAIQKFAPRFMGYNQQDAQEFLRYLLLGIHEDINRVRSRPPPLKYDEEADNRLNDQEKASEYWRRYLRIDDSKIIDIFVGQLKSTLTCSVCNHVSTTFDPFWDLSLPIKRSSSVISIQDCFQLFMREEILDKDEMPKCDNCKTRRKSTKSFSIWKFPQILVVHLKRFSQNNIGSKLTTTIELPQTLNLSDFGSKGSSDSSYKLYGVCNHSGSLYFGHYTATCLHPYSNDWHDFNDQRVHSSYPESRSSEAYVLFYERKRR